MPTPQTRNSNLPRPKRTLVLFLVGIVALYVLVALIGLGTKKGDDSVWKPKLGLDLQGGTSITLKAKPAHKGGTVTPTKLREARNIIDQRVNASGITEAEVTTQGGGQVLIEIPGKKEGKLVDKVGETAQLRFRLVWTGGLTSSPTPVDTSAQQKQIDAIDWSKLSLNQMLKAELDGVSTLPATYQPGIAALQSQAKGFQCLKTGLKVEDVANKPLVTCNPKTGEVEILSPAVIEGTSVKSAVPAIPPQSVEWIIQLALKGHAVKVFDTVSTALTPTQAQFAIVLDGKTISALSSQARITDGRSQIQGGFTAASSKALANQLKYGALPLSFDVNEVSEVGPSLAGSQLHAGLVAGLIGLILVVIYCLIYYRGLGLVIVGSLLVASALTFALVLLLGKGVGFTLTLPGIAGLIVAIGITADSFIVFFERIRDEVRDGKSLRLAVEAGWARARNTILAADAVSILAALTLFIFAIGVVRGFAFALGLTTLIDVFVVFLFTKPVVSLLARTKFFGQGHKLSGLDAGHLGISGRKVTEIARNAGGDA
ncbi:MAG: secD [Aeromicrobium sp.]|nr:secD [Aeromicrobium sp.]